MFEKDTDNIWAELRTSVISCLEKILNTLFRNEDNTTSQNKSKNFSKTSMNTYMLIFSLFISRVYISLCFYFSGVFLYLHMYILPNG